MKLVLFVFVLVIFSFFSCREKGELPRFDLLQTSQSKNKIYLTPLSGQGISPIQFVLKQSVETEMVAFFVNNKRIEHASMLNDPDFGVTDCQFKKNKEVIIGAACLLNLAVLDSPLNKTLEYKLISYIDGKNEQEFAKKMALRNFLPSFLVLVQSGPFLRLETQKEFFIQNEKEAFRQRFYEIVPLKEEIKKHQKIVLTVNFGNFLSSPIPWASQKQKLKDDGLHCSLKEGLNGQLKCKVTNVSTLRNESQKPFYLAVQRKNKKITYQIVFRGKKKGIPPTSENRKS